MISGDAGRMHDCRHAHALDVDRIRNHSFARRSRRKPTPEWIAHSARAGGAPLARLEALIAANIGDLIAVTVFTFRLLVDDAPNCSRCSMRAALMNAPRP